jgi:hypothetical protein
VVIDKVIKNMPTTKQKKTFEKSLENGGVVSRAAKGIYSDAMAKNPQKITKTKGWEELMKTYLPDKLLAEKHKELLNAEIKRRSYKKGDLEFEEESIDTQAVSKGLDMAYKLKGRYNDKPNDKPPETHIHFHNDKVLNLIKQSEDEILKELELNIQKDD